MKILVGISKTPDTTARIAFTDDNTKFNEDGIQFIMNPYDEWYALVRALELKEAHGGTVTVVHVGSQENETIIRKALAIGADDAIRIDKNPQSSLDVATQIANLVSTEGFDLILLGKETINYNGSEVGSMLGGLLSWPFFSYATAMEMIDEKNAEVTRDTESGGEKILAQLPVVISAAKGLAEQRIPNMRGIMMAKRKPLRVIEPVEVEERTTITHYELPPQRSDCQLIDPDKMDTLVRLLHEEAKVI